MIDSPFSEVLFTLSSGSIDSGDLLSLGFLFTVSGGSELSKVPDVEATRASAC
ncbi:7487_t:CDS:2 [Ambispora leptoticha]|uniref:7487_t:CDS:1 n=1 Tax=Ambispora leptoticha TaxID=144679 RepID=A0A9N9C684_9GLOM|nr:7487_t:CDS:2 [Ambispora leptoticha]